MTSIATPETTFETLTRLAATLSRISKRQERNLDEISGYNEQTQEFDLGADFESQEEAHDELMEMLGDDVDTLGRVADVLTEIAGTLARAAFELAA